jgi:hypothetical protein
VATWLEKRKRTQKRKGILRCPCAAPIGTLQATQWNQCGDPFDFIVFIDGRSFVRFTGPGAQVLDEFELIGLDCVDEGDNDPQPFVFTGTLAPGSYTLEAGSSATGQSSCYDIGGGVTCFQRQGGGT